MTMKHYHDFGLDTECRRLLKLLSGSGVDSDPRYSIRREKAECRIKGGSMFTCKRIPVRFIDGRPTESALWICPHLVISANEWRGTFCVRKSASRFPTRVKHISTELPAENVAKRGKSRRNLRSDIEQCHYCRTEYLVTPEKCLRY